MSMSTSLGTVNVTTTVPRKSKSPPRPRYSRAGVEPIRSSEDDGFVRTGREVRGMTGLSDEGLGDECIAGESIRLYR